MAACFYRPRLILLDIQRRVVSPEHVHARAYGVLLLAQVMCSNGRHRLPSAGAICHDHIHGVVPSMHGHMRQAARHEAGVIRGYRLAQWSAYAGWRRSTCRPRIGLTALRNACGHAVSLCPDKPLHRVLWPQRLGLQ